ncbi:MAG: helix-turn-helix transcriptional regulator [Ruminococcaceae bacterium]|nr:helix-turn-helix transcriptional regulator [Oscillospiraceae bacterium]
MINSQFFDSVLINDISVISGVRYNGRTVDNSYSGRKHHGFLYIHSGEATFYADGTEFVVLAGSLLYIPKNKKYRMVYTAESTTFVVVNFMLQDLNGKNTVLFENMELVLKDQKTNSLAQVMTKFELCSASKNIGALFRKKELMYRLLGLICGGGSHSIREGEVDARIARGVYLLEQTYLENLPIAQYAEESYTSVNTFRRVFQKQFGISPIKYRNLMRIDRAKELLYEGSFTVAEVAYAVGFENIGYFCRYYRQITGETPTETKRKNH